MGFRFYRRINLFRGVSLNFGKRGASVSVGPRGAKMTFGPRGTRASVGLPGTGMRYEKTFGGKNKMARPPRSKSSPTSLLVICAVVALLSLGKSVSDPSVLCILLFVLAVVVGIVMLIAKAFSSNGGNATGSYTNIRKTTGGDRVTSEMADASMALYRFLQELDRTPRCRKELAETPGLEGVGVGGDHFTITQKLGFLVFCDLRDIYARLGHDTRSLHNREGVGYAMLILLLISKEAELAWFNDPTHANKLLSIVEDLSKSDVGHITIEGHENELRFALIFGQMHHEQDWVNRYATLLYRWASLVAKASGSISQAESDVLKSIMELRTEGGVNLSGNVRISGTGEIPGGESASNAEDDMTSRLIQLILDSRRVSTSWFQRKLGLNYYKAAETCDCLAKYGVVKVDDIFAEVCQYQLAKIELLENRDSAVCRALDEIFGCTHNDETHNHKKSASQKVFTTDGLKSLNELIGLEPVKREVRKLASFIDIQRKREKSGLRAAPVSYHCVFTGNPGTGKTTVARILTEIYREMGVVKKGHLVETDRSGLVGEYVGQTAVKTNKIIDTALDGVLFIDEAYSLIQGGEKDYGREAIATLLKRMEDDRKRLVVILAGYTNEMKQFLDSNPGLQSRFNRYIEFPDYNAEELAKIFLKKTEECQYTCNKDVRASIVDIMKRAVETKDKNFGNGRFVRNLFENAIQRQAVRLSTQSPLTAEMLAELTLHDLGFAYEN